MPTVSFVVNLSLYEPKIPHATIHDRIDSYLIKQRHYFCTERVLLESGLFSKDEIAEYDGWQIGLGIRDELESAQCFCMEFPTKNPEQVFWWDDYVDSPMVMCSRCGTISVICVNCERGVDIGSGLTKFTYPLMIIDKVINEQIYAWKWTTELARKYLNEFLAINRDHIDRYPCDTRAMEFKMANTIGLEPNDHIKDGQTFSEEMWALAPVAGTYDATDLCTLLDVCGDNSVYMRCHCPECGTKLETRYCVN